MSPLCSSFQAGTSGQLLIPPSHAEVPPVRPGCLGTGGQQQLHSLVSSDRSWEPPSLPVSWTGERISLTLAKDTGCPRSPRAGMGGWVLCQGWSSPCSTADEVGGSFTYGLESSRRGDGWWSTWIPSPQHHGQAEGAVPRHAPNASCSCLAAGEGPWLL